MDLRICKCGLAPYFSMPRHQNKRLRANWKRIKWWKVSGRKKSIITSCWCAIWYDKTDLIKNKTCNCRMCSICCKQHDMCILCNYSVIFNTLRPRQNGRHFADDTFNRIFLNENAKISIKFSLKFVFKGPINTIRALVQIMAWRRPGDKPLSEPVMVSLLTHICVTRPQWVNIYLSCCQLSIIALFPLVAMRRVWTCVVWLYKMLNLTVNGSTKTMESST